MNLRSTHLGPVALIFGLLCGCGDFASAPIQSARTEGWSQAQLPGVSQDAAFDAGVYAMKQWFRLEEVSPSLGQIRSVPTEYTQSGGTDRIRDTALKFRNRMRRTATLAVLGGDDGAVARCEVRVQRLDTSDYRIFKDMDRFDDYSSETPIESGAGATPEQRETWTDLPRDRKLEGEILSVIRNRLKKPAAP